MLLRPYRRKYFGEILGIMGSAQLFIEKIAKKRKLEHIDRPSEKLAVTPNGILLLG